MRKLNCSFAMTMALALTMAGCHREQKPEAKHPEAPSNGHQEHHEEHHPNETEEQQPAPQPGHEGEAEGEAARPGMAPGPAVARTTHDLVVDALVCGLPEGSMATKIGPRGGGPSMSPSAPSMEARCNALAPHVSAAAFSKLDENSVRAVRDSIEQRAQQERLDDIARMQMLALYDRGIEAEREALQAMQTASRFADSQGNIDIEAQDLTAMSARDRLQDLLLYARSSGSGAMATEAEGLAWVLASDRFLQVESLPPPLRVFAAEPLFESMLGVPTPQQAESFDIRRVNQQVWSQYLETAAKAAEILPRLEQQPSGQRMQPGPARAAKARVLAQQQPGARPPPSAGRGEARGARAMSAEDQQNMQQIVSVISQRIEALSRRMPASDLRMTLDSYAAELRTLPVGGGPQEREQKQRPGSRGPSRQ